MKMCKKCGTMVDAETKFCTKCGEAVDNTASAGGSKSMAAFVIGLIGAIFGLFGGLCVSACYGFSGNDGLPLILMCGGSVVGLVGSCMCLNKAKIGCILEFVGAVMIAICAFGFTGADLVSLVGMAMLAVGGVVGFLTAKNN